MATVRGKNLTSKEVAQFLGVSEASVKRWADSGLLPVEKTAGGHRRFSPKDVALFRRAASHESRPRALKNSFPATARWRTSDSVNSEQESDGSLTAEMYQALIAGNNEEASSLFVIQYLNGRSVASIADAILCTAMRKIGDLWHRGELSIVQEHVATRAALMALQTLRTVLGSTAPGGLLAVCCSTEEDFHELPVQLAALILEAIGGEVVNMGTSTPFYVLAEAVASFKPQLVCVASTILTNLDRAAREYEGLRRAAKAAGASIVLGGAGFADAQVRGRFPAELHADSFQQLESFAATLTAVEETKG